MTNMHSAIPEEKLTEAYRLLLEMRGNCAKHADDQYDDPKREAKCEALNIAMAAMGRSIPPCWNSVEERLPGDDHDWVLAIGKFVPENTYGKPIISELRKDGKWWGDINDEFPLEHMGIRITHWMPLPEPPKEATP